MKAVVIVGNESISLDPLIRASSVPMLPVANTPLALHIVDQLRRCGFTEIIFCVYPEDAEIIQILGDGNLWGISVRYLVADIPMGSAGFLHALTPVLSGAPFLVSSMQLLFSDDLERLLAEQSFTRPAASVVLAETLAGPPGFDDQDSGFFGHEDFRSSHEPFAEPFDDTSIPVGIYILDPSTLELLTEADRFLDIQEDLLPTLVAQGMPVAAHHLHGPWRYMKTIDDYVHANMEALEGLFGEHTQGEEVAPGVWLGEDVAVGRNVQMVGPIVIGEGTTIATGTRIVGPTAIGRECRVGRNATIKESIVWNRSVIGENCQAERVVLGHDTRLERERRIHHTLVFRHAAYMGQDDGIPTWQGGRSKELPPGDSGAPDARSGLGATLKRVIDFTGALLMLAATLPLFIIIAVVLRMEGQGTILRRRRFYGRVGREFVGHAFRTDSAEQPGDAAVSRLMNRLGGMSRLSARKRWAAVARAWIARLHLDRLPLLWNVLVGDMSIVGPEPVSTRDFWLYPGIWVARRSVKPGLTGVGRIFERSRPGIQRGMAAEMYYATHQSLSLDFKILLRMPIHVGGVQPTETP